MNAPTNAAAMALIDDLLDGTLDDLEDMPTFAPFPGGAHRCTLKMELKDINGLPAVDVSLVAIETMELSNPEDAAAKAGDKCNELLMLKKKNKDTNAIERNELGEGKLKELLKPLAAHFGTATNRETIAAANGAEVVAITKVRIDKRDANDLKYYLNIVSLSVV